MFKKMLLLTVIIMTLALSQDQYIKQDDMARLSPRLLNYQGYLTDTLGIPITNPSLSMAFSIYDALSAGNQKWTETQASVSVDKGVFSVLLGSVTPIPDTVFTAGTDRWLELVVGGQTLMPRTRIVSSAYAYTATYSDTALYARNAAADNDWTISGNNQYSTVSGNVGIGTSTPSEKLEVIGDIRVLGNASAGDTAIELQVSASTSGKGGKVLIKAGDGQNSVSANHWGGDVEIRAGTGENNSGGNVGIRGGMSSVWTLSTNPTNVNIYGGGNDAAPGYYYNSGLITVEGAKQLGSGSSNRSGGNILLMPGLSEGSGVAGLVGINTSNPGAKLDIAGNVKIVDGTQGIGKVFTSDANGLGSWQVVPNDNNWSYLISDGADTTLQMNGRWGIARLGNTMYGNADSTHVNLGIGSTTGANGQNYKYNTIGGGYGNIATYNWTTVGGGDRNTAGLSYATVGGGVQNNAGGQCATVSGGSTNVATSECATVAGGNVNTASNYNATVSGGQGNIASGYIATVGGGKVNRARGQYSVVSGGGGASEADSNSAIGNYSAIGGGRKNIASGEDATVGGGAINTASGWNSTVGGGNANSANNWNSIVGGGAQNTASGQHATVGGGQLNSATSNHAAVGGGAQNTASSSYAIVGGGRFNAANNNCSAIVGGYGNTAADSFSLVGGGYYNIVAGKYSAILGGFADTIAAGANYSYLFGINSNLTQDSTFMVDMPHIRFGTEAAGYEFPVSDGSSGQALVTNGSGQVSWGSTNDNDWTFLISDGADTTLQMGGQWGLSRLGNTLYGNVDSTHVNLGVNNTTGTNGQNYKYATVSGGRNNVAGKSYATVGGGQSNDVINDGDMATIAGGVDNTASGYAAFIGGGANNAASGSYAVISGGGQNIASGGCASTGGGAWNRATGAYSTVAGGYYNYNAGDYSAIVGGIMDTIAATGDFSYLFGINSNLTQDSTFMVDMPHIRFGTEAAGYEFPVSDGSNGQALVTNGSGQVSWGSTNDNDWSFLVSDGADTTLQTGGRWGIARAGNTLYGNADSTHVNFGVGSTTGTNGQNYKYSTVSGGYSNTASGTRATVGGGNYNISNNTGATVGGGIYNIASGASGTVGGGQSNTTSGEFATIGGGYGNTASDYSAAVGGGMYNIARGLYSVVSGGGGGTQADSNSAIGDYSAIGGGSRNTATNFAATVSGGYTNTASGYMATVGGGQNNAANNLYATVGGGIYNTASGSVATVGGGYANTASGERATVGGGYANNASGNYAMVPGGYYASASLSGQFAHASGMFALPGDAQTSVYVLRRTSTGSSGYELYLDGGSARLTIASGRVMTFDLLIVGSTSGGSESAGYKIQGVIKNAAGTTAFVGTPTVTALGEDDAAWDAQVNADDTNDALAITVQGNGEDIRWVATVRTSEVAY